MKSSNRKIIKWEIIHFTNQNRPEKNCSLCNLERVEIASADNNKILNYLYQLENVDTFAYPQDSYLKLEIQSLQKNLIENNDCRVFLTKCLSLKIFVYNIQLEIDLLCLKIEYF